MHVQLTPELIRAAASYFLLATEAHTQCPGINKREEIARLQALVPDGALKSIGEQLDNMAPAEFQQHVRAALQLAADTVARLVNAQRPDQPV